MKITEISLIIRPLEYAGEKFINLCELENYLEKNTIEMDECLITPYYIQDNKRLELYQFEFYCTNELDFEEYILKITGKKKVDEVPQSVFQLKRKCFSKCGESDKLIEFIKFLFESNLLKEEIERAFGEFVFDNLFVVIY